MLGLAGGITAAMIMLLLGIGANTGIYQGAAEAMQNWHMFFNLSASGVFTGMIEAFIITFVFTWIFGVIYNALLGKRK